jgi:hypothetical protein
VVQQEEWAKHVKGTEHHHPQRARSQQREHSPHSRTKGRSPKKNELTLTTQTRVRNIKKKSVL